MRLFESSAASPVQPSWHALDSFCLKSCPSIRSNLSNCSTWRVVVVTPPCNNDLGRVPTAALGFIPNIKNFLYQKVFSRESVEMGGIVDPSLRHEGKQWRHPLRIKLDHWAPTVLRLGFGFTPQLEDIEPMQEFGNLLERLVESFAQARLGNPLQISILANQKDFLIVLDNERPVTHNEAEQNWTMWRLSNEVRSLLKGVKWSFLQEG